MTSNTQIRYSMEKADIRAWFGFLIDESWEASPMIGFVMKHPVWVAYVSLMAYFLYDFLTETIGELTVRLFIWSTIAIIMFPITGYFAKRTDFRSSLIRGYMKSRDQVPQWKQAFAPKALFLEPDGILEESVNFRNRVPWVDIRLIGEKDDYIYIRLVDPRKGRYLIPKKAFNDAGHAMAFLDEARTLWIAAVGKR